MARNTQENTSLSESDSSISYGTMSTPRAPVAESSNSDSSEKGSIKDHIIPNALAQDAKLVTADGNIVTKDGIVISTEESDHSLAGNVFLDPEIRAYYVGVYEKSKYECRHVFDHELTWTKEEEKKLVRKLDIRGMAAISLLSVKSISN